MANIKSKRIEIKITTCKVCLLYISSFKSYTIKRNNVKYNIAVMILEILRHI